MSRNTIFRNGFFAFSLLNVVGNGMHSPLLANITKPFLVLLLLGSYFVAASPISRLILAALLLSWLGDVLLIFQSKDSLFFMAGLASFLLAHVFYILYFVRRLRNEGKKVRLITVLLAAAYLFFVLSFLWNGLGELMTPVLVYMFAIGTMLVLALNTKEIVGGKYFMVGAILFAISDSLLALNKFYEPFFLAGALIMATYIAAQYFIVKGAALEKQTQCV